MSAAYRRPSDVAMVLGSVFAADRPDDAYGTDEGGEADEDAGSVYLSHLPSGSLVVLQGISALIYVEAVNDAEGPPEHDVVTRLAASVGLAPDDIRDDVHAFLAELMSRGLLEATSPAGR